MNNSESLITIESENIYAQAVEIIEYLKLYTECTLVNSDSPKVRSMAHFHDLETGKLVFSTPYEYMSLHHPRMNQWIWSWYQNWNNPSNAIGLAKGLVNYFIGTDISSSTDIFNKRKIVLTPAFPIYYDESVDRIINLAWKMCKKPIYPFFIKISDGDFLIAYLYLIDNDGLMALRSELMETPRWRLLRVKLLI